MSEKKKETKTDEGQQMFPYLYDETKVTPDLSKKELEMMQSGDVRLNVIEEPMDHFTTVDDSFLKNLITKKQKQDNNIYVVLKDDMKDITKEVMDHWYNVTGKQYDNYHKRYFDKKWSVIDNSGKG